MKDNKIEYNTGKFKINFVGLTISMFLNGRLDIVGLTDEENAKIDYWYNLSRVLKK
jgi:hypothetical protein